MTGAPRPRSRARNLAFAALATALGLLAIEGIARGIEAAGAGGSVDARSNLSFQQLPGGDLLVPTDGADGPRLAAVGDWLDRQGWSVLRDKPADELRVVWIGGSAAAGWNSPTSATMARILERILDDAVPDRRVRVLNMARTGYASPQLAWVVEQVLPALQPDLVLSLMGNNEKHDLVVAANLSQAGVGPLLWAQRLSRASALVRLLRLARPLEPGAQQELFDPYLLDDQGEIVRFAVQRMGDTLGRIHAQADALGAPVLFVTVPINERLHGSWGEWAWLGEAADEDVFRLAHWAAYYDGAPTAIPGLAARVRAQPDDVAARIVLAELTLQAGDPEASQRIAGEAFAQLGTRGGELSSEQQRMFAWASRLATGEPPPELDRWVQQAEESGDVGSNGCLAAELLFLSGLGERARRAFEACADRTRFLRGGPPINERILQVAQSLGAPSFDFAGALAELSPTGLADYRYFWDYCHYNPRGNWVGAHLLAPAVAAALDLDVELPSAAEAAARWSEQRADRRLDLLEMHSWAGIDGDPQLLTQEYFPDDERTRAPLGQPEWIGSLFQAHRETGRLTVMEPGTLRAAREGYEEALRAPDAAVVEAAKEGLERLARAAAAEGVTETE